MKHIVETYGVFILSFLVAALAFGFVFFGIRDDAGNAGIFAMAGAGASELLTDSRPGTDFVVYAAESQKTYPAISCVAASACAAGRETAVSELFTAQDGDGQALAFYILSVTGPDGADQMTVVSADQSTVLFPSPGIYTFEIKTQDAQNRETVKTVCIPVNGGG